MTPLVPDARIDAKDPPPSIVIDLVIVTAPKPPASRTLISPPSAVFEMAPANVLHGAVRLHGLASSPTPDTQVRVACACAEETQLHSTTNPTTVPIKCLMVIMIILVHQSLDMVETRADHQDPPVIDTRPGYLILKFQHGIRVAADYWDFHRTHQPRPPRKSLRQWGEGAETRHCLQF